MATLISKVQTLISANLHAMVDKALESNSVAVMDEYIRQAEDNLEKLEDTVVTVGGTVKTLKRKWEQHEAEADKLDRSIDTLLLQGKKELAAAAQTRLNSSRRIAADYEGQFHEQQKQYEQLLACAAQAGSQADHHPPGTRASAGPAGVGQIQRGGSQGDQVAGRSGRRLAMRILPALASPSERGLTGRLPRARCTPAGWTRRWMKCWKRERSISNWRSGCGDWVWRRRLAASP